MSDDVNSLVKAGGEFKRCLLYGLFLEKIPKLLKKKLDDLEAENRLLKSRLVELQARSDVRYDASY